MSGLGLKLGLNRFRKGANLNQASEWDYEGVMTAGKIDISSELEMPEGSAFVSGYSRDEEEVGDFFGSITPLMDNIIGESYSDGILIFTVMGSVVRAMIHYSADPSEISIIEIDGTEYALTSTMGGCIIDISEDPFEDGEDYTIKIKATEPD